MTFINTYMFEYKNAEYFSEYFRNHPDFELIEEFKVSDDKKEKNLYVGQVEVKGTIHPLIIRVEIPFTFPHHKLTFRTKSLSGYPHLIHNGKIEYGDWFCLNTPFAETVEEQLNQEIRRLKEWIHRQMNPELPPVISDPDVKRAVSIASVYEWENPDEVNEFSSKARVTFVGDCFQNASNFKKLKGCFHCVKSPDNRLYVFMRKIDFASQELPYIIVDHLPNDGEILEDFLRLKDFYEWDENVCKHVLPNSYYRGGNRISASSNDKYEIEYSEDDALRLIEQIYANLDQEESYLPQEKHFLSKLRGGKSPMIKVPNSYKHLIKEELEKAKLEILHNHGVKFLPDPYNRHLNEDEFDENEAMAEHWFEYEQYKFDYFAIGLDTDKQIHWFVFYTNPAYVRYNQTSYDVAIKNIHIKVLTDITLNMGIPQIVSRKMFFGRGVLNNDLVEKRIALVGLGAIGSMVAEALAHSGIKHIGLWDGDIIEPGNICRSAYQLSDLGESKVRAIAKKIHSINPYARLEDITANGWWDTMRGPNFQDYIEGDLYGNINYANQEDVLREIKGYDVIIDCTGSNEMLHFLSYAVKDKDIIGLCITNHANELVCVSNADGNPFELRKAYLSRIEQDTKNFYVEGEGCYSPTFLAKYSDIAALVNLCIKEVDKAFSKKEAFHSATYGYCDSGILIDRIRTMKLEGHDIIMNVPEEVLLDARDLYESHEGYLGYVLGTYSSDGKQILVTHIVSSQDASRKLEDAFQTSQGIIDYIGDYAYSSAESDSFTEEMLETITGKAADTDVNTNNPLLALRTKSGDIEFYLFLNNQLILFKDQ